MEFEFFHSALVVCQWLPLLHLQNTIDKEEIFVLHDLNFQLKCLVFISTTKKAKCKEIPACLSKLFRNEFSTYVLQFDSNWKKTQYFQRLKYEESILLESPSRCNKKQVQPAGLDWHEKKKEESSCDRWFQFPRFRFCYMLRLLEEIWKEMASSKGR